MSIYVRFDYPEIHVYVKSFDKQNCDYCKVEDVKNISIDLQHGQIHQPADDVECEEGTGYIQLIETPTSKSNNEDADEED